LSIGLDSFERVLVIVCIYLLLIYNLASSLNYSLNKVCNHLLVLIISLQ